MVAPSPTSRGAPFLHQRVERFVQNKGRTLSSQLDAGPVRRLRGGRFSRSSLRAAPASDATWRIARRLSAPTLSSSIPTT